MASPLETFFIWVHWRIVFEIRLAVLNRHAVVVTPVRLGDHVRLFLPELAHCAACDFLQVPRELMARCLQHVVVHSVSTQGSLVLVSEFANSHCVWGSGCD